MFFYYTFCFESLCFIVFFRYICRHNSSFEGKKESFNKKLFIYEKTFTSIRHSYDMRYDNISPDSA